MTERAGDGTAALSPAGEFTTLFLNLPNEQVITRRYMCSYNSPMSLFPPYELISLAGIVLQWKKRPAHVIDAVAERLDRQQVLRRIGALRPDLIVTIAGFECFGQDMDEIAAIKAAYPGIAMALFGHYPTTFPDEVLLHSAVDYVLMGEPDLNFSELYDRLVRAEDPQGVSGVACRDRGGPRLRSEPSRIATIESLPPPAFELLPPGAYGEPAMARPFGLIQAARGCPYACNYCVRSYGTRLVLKSPEQVLDEIQLLIRHQRIRSLRFIDDTFTANRKWAINLCRRMATSRLGIEWSCLTRTDALDAELVGWLAKAGCRRIYFGLESGSQRILDAYNKRIDKAEAMQALLLCRQHGIETSGFFMLGLPSETEEDFQETVNFATASKLTFAMIQSLTLYPGTQLFDAHRDELEFSLFPYRNVFRDPAIEERSARWTREFYRRFYFSPGYPARNLRAFARAPLSMLRYAGDALQYAVLQRAGVANPFANIEPPTS